MDEAAPQRNYSLRDISNGLRSLLRTGVPWRMLPNDFPLWYVVYHQTQRWLTVGDSQMVHDLRMLLHEMTDCTLQRNWKAGDVPTTMGTTGAKA